MASRRASDVSHFSYITSEQGNLREEGFNLAHNLFQPSMAGKAMVAAVWAAGHGQEAERGKGWCSAQYLRSLQSGVSSPGEVSDSM